DAATSLLRLGAWCGIARNQAHRPLHHLKPHFLRIRTFPDGLNVAEAIVEHAALAVVLRPDDGEIFVGAPHAFAGEIDLVGVEAEQHTNILPGEILDLINLVEEDERRPKIFHSGKLCIFRDERRVELSPRVAIEIAAENLPVLGPMRECERGAVDANGVLALVAKEWGPVRLL